MKSAKLRPTILLRLVAEQFDSSVRLDQRMVPSGASQCMPTTAFSRKSRSSASRSCRVCCVFSNLPRFFFEGLGFLLPDDGAAAALVLAHVVVTLARDNVIVLGANSAGWRRRRYRERKSAAASHRKDGSSGSARAGSTAPRHESRLPSSPLPRARKPSRRKPLRGGVSLRRRWR